MAYLQQYPEKCAAAMKPVAEKLRELDVDVIVGPAMGGIVYAYELARQTGKRAIFTERVDNVMTLKRFSIRPGEKCIIAEDVVTTAKEATARSYVPYSHFSVGAAALLGDGTVVSGTNQENAAYPSGLCAERTTLFYANSRYPDQPVITLAIAARTEKDFIDNPIPPCGACRQVILETEKRYGQPIRILLYGKECIYEIKSIGDLLPLSFDASAMED